MANTILSQNGRSQVASKKHIAKMNNVRHCEGVGRETKDPVALRLQHLERVLDGDDYGATTRFACRIGVQFTTWHNAKNGRGLSQKLLLRLLDRIPGLSADWVLLGRPDGLSHAMFQALGVVDEEVERGRRPPHHR